MSPRPPLKRVLEWEPAQPLFSTETDAVEAELRPGRESLVSLSRYVGEDFDVSVHRKQSGRFGAYQSKRLRRGRLKDAIVMQYLIWRSTTPMGETS